MDVLGQLLAALLCLLLIGLVIYLLKAFAIYVNFQRPFGNVFKKLQATIGGRREETDALTASLRLVLNGDSVESLSTTYKGIPVLIEDFRVAGQLVSVKYASFRISLAVNFPFWMQCHLSDSGDNLRNSTGALLQILGHPGKNIGNLFLASESLEEAKSFCKRNDVTAVLKRTENPVAFIEVKNSRLYLWINTKGRFGFDYPKITTEKTIELLDLLVAIAKRENARA